MRLIALAFRNLLRNKRRTLLTALAIMFGAAAIIVLDGFGNGFVKNIIESVVLSKIGPVQIFHKGYIGSDDPLKLSLKEDPALLSRIAQVPGVTAVAPRISFDGMISNGSESTMFMADAIDPELEYKVCPKRLTRVARGSQPLQTGREGDALIGKTLAESMGATLGATLVMQAAGPHASTNALDIEVSGFLPTYNIAESKRLATVRLKFAQEILRMKGQVTQYVVGVADLQKTDQVAAQVRAALSSNPQEAGLYQVTTWHELDPATKMRTQSMDYVLGFVALVLFLLVATGIVNTMLMSVYERVREIGTMLAVGVRRRQVMALFMYEALALGSLSAIAGTAIGFLIVQAIARKGVTMVPPGGDQITIYPYSQGRFLLIVIGFSIVGTVLSALYPAWKAARLRPVDALRAN
jgi:putative ABC transport system permease protein